MELIHKLARNNDYTTFKKVLIDEVGIGNWYAISKILDTTQTPKHREVITMCCDVYNNLSPTNITMKDIISKNKSKYIVEARQIVCYLLRKYTGLTQEVIGRIIYRNHATVIHSTRIIEQRYGMSNLLISNDVFDKLKEYTKNIYSDG